MMENQLEISFRGDTDPTDRWNLTILYKDHAAWLKDIQLLDDLLTQAEAYHGFLNSSSVKLFEGLEYLTKTKKLLEKLSCYAFLNVSVDAGDDENQTLQSIVGQSESRTNAALSFFEPELQRIPRVRVNTFFEELPELEAYRIMLEKLFRMQPHTLSEKEEQLMALYGESRNTVGNTFSLLVNADMEFGKVKIGNGSKRLSRQNLSWFLIQPDRDLRQRAYRQYYEIFDNHKHTLAALYSGSVQGDVYASRIRKYPSARASVLYKDDIPESVYSNIVNSVHTGLPLFHEFFRVKKEFLELDVMRPYDLEMPLIQSVHVDYSYENAVEIIIAALEPFGRDYTDTLRQGLLKGWVDRYENRGKRAGAFTAACYSGEPYILLNYKPSVLRNLFTLAHESGHAMHSWYSAHSNPFQNYEYSILEAETAANMHERLLYDYLLKQTDDKQYKAFLLERLLNDITAKIFRQTMLAEFEHKIHAEVEIGNPVTTAGIREIFRNLSTIYYGPDVTPDELSDLEGLTIPHFYQAYYVYTYATGASAALTLSQGILLGDDNAVGSYMDFLRSGGSEYPVQSLRKAGADITASEVFKSAVSEFSELLEQFKTL